MTSRLGTGKSLIFFYSVVYGSHLLNSVVKETFLLIQVSQRAVSGDYRKLLGLSIVNNSKDVLLTEMKSFFLFNSIYRWCCKDFIFQLFLLEYSSPSLEEGFKLAK